MAPRADPGAVSERPLEEHLQQNSLWPEIFKVYGHGNDLFALAADPLGCCLASSCRSQVSLIFFIAPHLAPGECWCSVLFSSLASFWRLHIEEGYEEGFGSFTLTVIPRLRPVCLAITEAKVRGSWCLLLA